MLAGVGGQHRMARPYSQDLRERVVGSVAGGRTCRATALLFEVSVASVVKWSQRYRATGSAAAGQMGGRKQLLLLCEREWLLARLAEKPDLTLRAVVAELAERGTPASYGAVWRFFKHEGITFKKSLHTSRIAPTSRAGAGNGRSIRAGLTLDAWSSSTRPGPRPT
jgi:transposase